MPWRPRRGGRRGGGLGTSRDHWGAVKTSSISPAPLVQPFLSTLLHATQQMIRFLTPLALAAVAAAQTPNTLEIYSGTTSFTSRGTVGVNAGEVHQGFHGSHWGAIGDSGASSTLVGLTYVTQD